MVLTQSRSPVAAAKEANAQRCPQPPSLIPGRSPTPTTYRRPAGVHSLWRLRSYLRPYYLRARLHGGDGPARRVREPRDPAGHQGDDRRPDRRPRLERDHPARSRSRSALGIVEAALILVRRWVQAGAVLGFETSVRNDLYRHMQELPMEFHSRWQSGQLLSRITMDLSSIRRFMGFGLLFLFINIIQLTLVTAAAAQAVLAARSGGRAVGGADHLAEQALRVALRRRVAAGPGPAGRRGHGGRGGRHRLPGDQVLRPPPLQPGQLPRQDPDALRDLDGEGPPVGALLDLPRGHPEHLARHRAAARRVRRRRRRT